MTDDADRLGARDRHVYDHGAVPPLALSRDLPPDEATDLDPPASRLGALAVKLRTLFDPFDELQDYDDLFALSARPAILGCWRDDLAFAEQRLAGPHPRVLRRIDHLPDNLRIDDDHARDALAQAGFEGRLFLADYAILHGIPAGGHHNHSRFLYAPLALFTWEPDVDAPRDAPPSQRGALRPAAIQLDQAPIRGNLYTPADGLDWLLARTVVQNADHVVAAIAERLARLRLGMEPFALASARQLADAHPIRRLLRPHLRGLVGHSHHARRELAPDGPVERLYGPSLAGSLELIRRSALALDHDDARFPRDLELRGLHDDLLPHYPWRDDGRLVWSALHEFVAAYLRLTYPDDPALAADSELRAWLDELRSPAGGRLRGTPAEPERGPLVDLLTHVIFSLGPVHAAMSTGLADYAAFAPNFPAALYSPMPPRGAADERALLAMLPPQAQSLEQLRRAAPPPAPGRPLGEFAVDPHDEPHLHDLVVILQERLVGAEQRILRRNGERPLAHRGLLPSTIPGGLGP